MSYLVSTFYKFFEFNDYEAKSQEYLGFCQSHQIQGTMILAPEGLNATVAGSPEAIAQLYDYLRSDRRLADLTVKESPSEKPPFGRLRIKLKSEIVTFRQDNADPRKVVGTYVKPQDWNQLIQDPEVVLVDTRNEYEYDIGTFRGAANPHIDQFVEFPDYIAQNLDPEKNPKVAMFCTGGIRCEKATSYLLQQGFKEVFHLEGGILKYLEEIPEDQSLWEGECFVFDERVAVKHQLAPGQYDLCRACGHPISPEDQRSPLYEADICCPHCHGQLTPEKRKKQRDRQLQREFNQRQHHSTLKMQK